jgi:hypothetical protein
VNARFRPSTTFALLVVILGGCGRSEPAGAPSTPAQTGHADVTATTESSADTTTVTATTLPTTAPPPTTSEQPTTTPPPVPAGWSPVDRASLSPKAFPPCCADTWHGEVSPALVPAGASLADGPYAVTAKWPDDPTRPLELEVFRFEQCALLPEFSCESAAEGYGPDELGVDASTSRSMTILLDGRVRVVVVGWKAATPGNDSFVVEQARGTDLATLAGQVDRAYAEVFADRFVAGEDPNTIVADVLATPTGGFTKAQDSLDSFVYTPDTGPPLLFQTVFPYDDGQRQGGRGTDALKIGSIDVVDGQLTVYVYAAYIP